MSEPPDLQTVSVSTAGAVGELLLDRPAKLNALSRQMLGEIVEAVRWLDAQRGLKAVVVRGSGKAFSAGADISAFGAAEGSAGGAAEVRRGFDLGRRATDAVAGMRAITVGAIHGHCIGGGVLIAAACDIRIAAEDARFSIPEVDIGIPLAWGGIPRLVRELGPTLTKDLVLTCRPFDAAEAARVRFVSRLVASDALLGEARAVAEKLAAQPAYALRVTKQHVDAVAEESGSTAQSYRDADTLLTAVSDEESLEVMARYLQARRRPA
jgi:enoyl-CoA hydratase/carnithine racemase